ncbi:hypothetical protein KQ939_09055 [Planococcus sp. CP5-4]|uniref:hypothetical protein n=1 Tax=unclassified Planococcus (in: firmicutes) TaxID=2662419 RepID=UPI001C2504E5|nr:MULTISPECIES: hypothetical protein [unclassified Planococcus (in: firmicutes)]MBU9675014.1 hypothetical protein [Planococcus sp. CP5-4_YE]MBV0910364.1 hypothetical protein [Planococcus sp. CP5-4_UN]MBW6063860.1 hypothetical protein [Planococcus sp. CP5-4]
MNRKALLAFRFFGYRKAIGRKGFECDKEEIFKLVEVTKPSRELLLKSYGIAGIKKVA